MNPMRSHNRFRFMFTTQLVDRDIPQPLYEERTLKEKIVYDVEYPEEDQQIVEDQYSWQIHRLRKHLPIGKEAPYGCYLDTQEDSEQELTYESVASKNVGSAIQKCDEQAKKRFERD